MRDVGLAVTDYMRDARRRLDEGLADAVATRMADLNADVDRLKEEAARPDVAGRAETVARTKAELAQLDESARRLLANADTPNWGTV
jgi:outer membrane murein-binding lipoprotein Lpp